MTSAATSTATDRAPAHEISLAINYEDTDAGGVVYYGNYLGYMERARNDYLRSLGYPLGRLERDAGVVFVVTEARLKYRYPARLDDVLRVTLDVATVGAASIVFEHRVLREDELLVQGEIHLATLDPAGFKPRRIPAFLRERLAGPA